MKELLNKIDELKKQIDNFRPLKKSEIIQLKQFYQIGLTYSSNALEGNSLTETETKIVVEDGLTIGGKPLKDIFEAQGHSDAFNFMYSLIDNNKITENDILKLHHLFYYRIDEENAGEYRKVKVFVSGTNYKFPEPDDVPALMKKFVNELSEINEGVHPVEFAANAHKNFVEIHPFIDGNGRAARLLMNLILLKHGFPVTIIPPIRRLDYINALNESNKGIDEPFFKFISEMVYESLKEYIRLLGN